MPAPPPVAINLRAAVRPTITGVERYTIELSRRLLAGDPGHYRALIPRRRARGRAAGQAWEQLVLPVRARRLGVQLILSAANLAPLRWPGNVIVVHDAAALREPAAYSAAYRRWHEFAEFAAARRARAVITVSDFSRGELCTLAGLDPTNVHVIPGGVGAQFRAQAPDQSADAAALAAIGVGPGGLGGLGGPGGPGGRAYVLTVATADPRKNLSALAPVAAALTERGIDLVWAGDARAYFAELGAVPGLRSVGYVPDALLPALYRGARAFVLPSRYEGFGLTCVEAMACGTPVVAADRAALPETCGDAALLVDPDDPRSLTAAVLTAAMGDPARREALRAAGLRRAAQFSWERTAEKTDALLRRISRG